MLPHVDVAYTDCDIMPFRKTVQFINGKATYECKTANIVPARMMNGSSLILGTLHKAKMRCAYNCSYASCICKEQMSVCLFSRSNGITRMAQVWVSALFLDIFEHFINCAAV